MSPIIIIPKETSEITMPVEEFKKYINDAYNGGYQEGYEKGKNEKPYPTTTFRDFEKISTTPYCGETRK